MEIKQSEVEIKRSYIVYINKIAVYIYGQCIQGSKETIGVRIIRKDI